LKYPITGTRHLRTRLARAALLVAFIGLFGRLVWLQCVEHEKWAELARQAHYTERVIPAERGHVIDRNGRPLAISLPVESVYANPKVIGDPARAQQPLMAVMPGTTSQA